MIDHTCQLDTSASSSGLREPRLHRVEQLRVNEIGEAKSELKKQADDGLDFRSADRATLLSAVRDAGADNRDHQRLELLRSLLEHTCEERGDRRRLAAASPETADAN